jgi:hypothetical protein
MADDLPKERALRRIGEGTVATVVGGLILWFVTSSVSQRARTTETVELAIAPAAQPATDRSASASSATRDVLAPRLGMEAPPLASIGGSIDPAVDAEPAQDGPTPVRPSVATLPAPRPLPPLASVPRSINPASERIATQPPPPPAPPASLLPFSIPVGSILLYEDFSRYREGGPTDWGPNTTIKPGLDRRVWLVSNVVGNHPVGRRMRLPSEFYFECRYCAYTPEVTRGLVGWWKEPVSTTFAFLGDQGAKYTIEWVVKCGNDVTRPNPLGSASLYAKKYYHTFTLPDGTVHEVGVLQPTGVLRIDRDNGIVKVSLDSQAAVAGTIVQMGQLAGFEIQVVNAKNGALFFTDFKIGR